MDKKKKNLLILAVILVIVVLAAVWYFSSKKKEAPVTTTTSSTSGLAGLDLGGIIGGIGSFLASKPPAPVDNTHGGGSSTPAVNLA